jgi:hypothetical protein
MLHLLFTFLDYSTLARSGVRGEARMSRLSRQPQISTSTTIELAVDSLRAFQDETFSDYAIWW